MSDPHSKSMQICVKVASAPTDAQMEAIRQYTLRDFTADELMVRTFVLAHNGIDRDNECFDEPLLGDFARTIVAKGSYVCHPGGWNGDGGPAEGRVFGAELQRMSFDAARQMLRAPNLQFPPDRTEAVLLMTDAYFVRTPDNQSLLAKLDGGVAGDISIGFSATGPQSVTDADGRELTAQRWTSPGEALEQSLVWLGAQQGARAVKHADRNRNRNPEQETAMTPEEIKALQTKNAELETAKAAGEKAVQQLDAVRKALGDDAALVDTPEKLASLIGDGRKFKKSLVDDIVTLERHLQITGDTAEDVKAAQELYDAMPVAKLESVRATLEKRSPQARVKGGDPNRTAPGSTEKSGDGGQEKANPLENPALAGA